VSNDTDLDLTRFVRALNYGRKWILATSAVGLLFGVLLGFRSPTAQAVVSLQPDHKQLVEGGVIVELDTNSMLKLTASDLASEAYLNRLKSQLGVKLTITPTFSADRGDIQVVIEGDGKQNAESAATMMIVEAQARYAEEFSGPANESLTRLNGLLEAAQTRRTDIETRLQQAPAGPLADGLILDMEQQSTQVSRVQASASALSTIVGNAKFELKATSIETSKTHKIILYPVALAVAAGLLCAGWIVVRAAFDRKIRTRRDFERLGIHSLLGSLPVSHDATDDAIVGAAIASTSAHHKSHAVSVKSSPQADDAIAGIARAVNNDGTLTSVEILPGLDVSPLAITSAEAADLTTLVVEWGAIHAECLVQRVNQLSTAGAKQVCVVLVGVPDRLRSDYER
jgi:hypothetical protein